jgi:hypothetical protein
MKKSILIVGHQLEIAWKNQVIANGYSPIRREPPDGVIAQERRYR